MLDPSMDGDDFVGARSGEWTARVVRTAGLAALMCIALAATGCGDAGRVEGQSAPANALSTLAGSGEAQSARREGGASASRGQAADAERAALLARGEILSFSCRPCHGLAPGDESPVGPHLHGMFGRPAGQLEGFEYSPALRESGIVWTAETLDSWLAQPDSFLPGNAMAFAGFRSADDRRALIEFLRVQTASGTGPAPDTGDGAARGAAAAAGAGPDTSSDQSSD